MDGWDSLHKQQIAQNIEPKQQTSWEVQRNQAANGPKFELSTLIDFPSAMVHATALEPSQQVKKLMVIFVSNPIKTLRILLPRACTDIIILFKWVAWTLSKDSSTRPPREVKWTCPTPYPPFWIFANIASGSTSTRGRNRSTAAKIEKTNSPNNFLSPSPPSPGKKKSSTTAASWTSSSTSRTATSNPPNHNIRELSMPSDTPEALISSVGKKKSSGSILTSSWCLLKGNKK